MGLVLSGKGGFVGLFACVFVCLFACFLGWLAREGRGKEKAGLEGKVAACLFGMGDLSYVAFVFDTTLWECNGCVCVLSRSACIFAQLEL